MACIQNGMPIYMLPCRRAWFYLAILECAPERLRVVDENLMRNSAVGLQGMDPSGVLHSSRHGNRVLEQAGQGMAGA